VLDSIFAGEYATNIFVSLTTSILYPDLPEIASLKLCRLANVTFNDNLIGLNRHCDKDRERR
jgi:hypothetical protein